MSLALWIRRGESPLARALKRLAKLVLSPSSFRLPRFLAPPLRVMYEGHFFVIVIWHSLVSRLYANPLFQARCQSVGRNLVVDRLPFVNGHTQIFIGDDVHIGGDVSISSGRFLDNPKLSIGDRSVINWRTTITVNREVIIEEDVLISYDCQIADSDGHSRFADQRAAHAPPALRDIRPIRICRNAWIGNGSQIMKGVTIGEGAVIGAKSVVISDIPPYSLALGNPAEVYMENYGKPRKPRGGEASPQS